MTESQGYLEPYTYFTKDTLRRARQLLPKLKKAGSVGLDLSPGDPLIAEAVVVIEGLLAEVSTLKKVRAPL